MKRNILYIFFLVSSTKATYAQEDTILRGSKQYELTNHLGNVLATISDKRIQTNPAPGGTSGVTTELITASDYYAFGMQIPGRNLKSEDYRFGFNGKGNDNEVKGDGNEQDYGARIYDGRISRFLSTDPITQKYSELTPYQFASNRPIDGIDLDGLEHFNVVAEDYSDGSTLIVVSMAPNGLHQPFQVDINGEKVNKTYNDWGCDILQKEFGGLYVGGNNRLYKNDANGKPIVQSDYGVAGTNNLDQWSQRIIINKDCKPNKYKQISVDINDPIVQFEGGGTFEGKGNNQSISYTMPSSTTPIKVSFNFMDGGAWPNNFSITDPDGNVLQPESNGKSTANFTVSGGTTIRINIMGAAGEKADGFTYMGFITTTHKEDKIVVDTE